MRFRDIILYLTVSTIKYVGVTFLDNDIYCTNNSSDIDSALIHVTLSMSLKQHIHIYILFTISFKLGK
jgi:hypothetical protein